MVLEQEDLDPLPGALLGPLRGQLLDAARDPPAARVDLGLVELAGQGRRLGALLVGVAEDADRVEAALGKEALELDDVVLGLAGEAEDDVGAEARRRRQRAGALDQREEVVGAASALFPAQPPFRG